VNRPGEGGSGVNGSALADVSVDKLSGSHLQSQFHNVIVSDLTWTITQD